MHRLSRREWLLRAAALGAASAGGARAACGPDPLPPRDDARPAIVFVDDRERPQGARLEELRQRLAAHGMGEERAHLETIAVATDAQALSCAFESVRSRPPLAVCTASAAVARAALAHAGAVPLVFALHGDPIALGIVDSLGRRSTNATGFTFETPGSPDLKAFELIADAFPGTRRVLVLADAAWPRTPERSAALKRVRERLGLDVVVAEPSRGPLAELQRVGGSGAAAYLPSSDLLLQGAPELLAALQRQRVPHLAGDERLLRHGAMLAWAPRRFAHWDAMAVMLRGIAAGTPAREMAVQWPAERLLSVSLATWQRMGLVPSGRLLRRAHVVV